MLVTLFVDASFYRETKSAAYALYAISQVDRLNYSGRFTKKTESSAHAELAAIANALHIVLPHRLSAGATKVLIQTDCTVAINWIGGGKCPHPEVVEAIHQTLAKYRVAHELRHVKAHSGIGEPRLYCHDWCDRECRRIAKKMHAERSATPPPTRRGKRRK